MPGLTDALSFSSKDLDVDRVDPDPMIQFRQWFNEASIVNIPLANAMTLATSSTDGVPAARVVLLKEVDERGFVFFTNYNSRKSQHLSANPRACLLFHWCELERQIRIDGTIEKVSAAESDEYFQTRPRGSQIGAWASHQSTEVRSKKELEEAFAKIEQQYAGTSVPRPGHWGGFRVIPAMIEFWQGRANRMHDRILYTFDARKGWVISRLSP